MKKSTEQQQNIENQTLPLSPGQQLRKAREAKHLSIDNVAKELLINKTFLQGIEKDDYSQIAAPVYARGYLRAYAHFLQIPEESILNYFDNSNWCKSANAATTKVLTPISKTKKTSSKPTPWLILSLIVIFIIAIFFTWQNNKDKTETSSKIINAANNSTYTQINKSIS